MTGRFISTLVAVAAFAFPAAAAAQTTTNYTPPPPTTTTEVVPPPATSTEEQTPAPTTTDDAGVEAGDATSPAPAPAATPAPATTGTAPTTLAYTGSDVWLVGLLGLLALAGGAALMRTSRQS